MLDQPNTKIINELLTRSIDTIYPSKKSLLDVLENGKKLRIYMGIDPTADYIHLGHSTNYLLLEKFHKLGHKIIVLVGDFTARIGDPSDKSSARIQLSEDQVQANLKSFKQQISKILDLENTQNPIEFRFNSEWLSSLTFKDAVELASNFTVQQMIERDAFQIRIADNKPLFLHEFFYPLMQGYDSVALDTDIEIGGTDQTFNMLAGRTLVKRLKQKEKLVITTTLLTNPKTGEKLMSKSLGTGISIASEPLEMFSGVMAIADEGILQCFIDCTRLELNEIEAIKKSLKSGQNPKIIKMKLALEIVSMYHSKTLALQAQNEWESRFGKDKSSLIAEDFKISTNIISWADLIMASGVVESKSAAGRLIDQDGVKLNNISIRTSPFDFENGDILRIGKKKFLKLIKVGQK